MESAECTYPKEMAEKLPQGAKEKAHEGDS
jgi:hypothetical protein